MMVAQREEEEEKHGGKGGSRIALKLGGSRPSTRSRWNMGADALQGQLCPFSHQGDPNSQRDMKGRDTKGSPIVTNFCHKNSTNHSPHTHPHQVLD